MAGAAGRAGWPRFRTDRGYSSRREGLIIESDQYFNVQVTVGVNNFVRICFHRGSRPLMPCSGPEGSIATFITRMERKASFRG